MKVKYEEDILYENNTEENIIKSTLTVMIQHMLKLKYQKDYLYKRSWILTIKKEQNQLIDVFPKIGKGSLYNSFYMKKFDLDSVYQKALNRAVRETRLPKEVFPEYCEWTKKELSDLDFISNFIEEYGYGPNEKD